MAIVGSETTSPALGMARLIGSKMVWAVQSEVFGAETEARAWLDRVVLQASPTRKGLAPFRLWVDAAG